MSCDQFLKLMLLYRISFRKMFYKTILFLTLACLCFAEHTQHQFSHEGRFGPLEYFESPFNHILVPSYRLNLTVKPLHYSLHMRPVLDDGFPGLIKFSVPSSVIISVESITNGGCNTITLHQRNLTIDLNSVTVKNVETGKVLAIYNHTFEEARDLYTIHLQDEFEFGDKLEIFIRYTVHLSQTENVGIYLGHYVNPDTNQTHYLSTTKLEPYHARKVLPLFDEPSLKAKFSVSVGRLEGKYHSLSNMEILHTEKDSEVEGWVWDHYEESVYMSPYLLCFIVSDFANDTVEIPEINRTVSAWAPRHDIEDGGGSYASSTGAKILGFFENRFKMEYALRKLDAVALLQFASGAMENFGLVTYRHAYLVWIPGENTEADRRKVTQVLSHEILHQWFGNVVTCAWWSEIWLNEGFARYFQFWGMNATIPEFLVEEAFVHDATQLAMVFDQGPLTHPVRNSAESTNESAAVFDRISYEKGASLLKMMEGFLGRDLLEHALADVYLQKMKWGSAYQEDLFQSIQEAIELNNAANLLPPRTNIEHVMTEWTLTSGYPLIRINAINQNTISISQERFSLNSKKPGGIKSGTLWWVPVKITNPSSFEGKDYKPDLWIPHNVSVLTYTNDNMNTSTTLMVNPDAYSYYRVLYDTKLTRQIKAQLDTNHHAISSSSRSQLLDDYFNLALGNYINIETALELTHYLGKESASNVWTSVLVHWKPILAKFSEDEGSLEALRNYLLPRIKDALSIIGLRQIAGERGINVTLRAQLLDMACQLQLNECREYAVELMNEWMENPNNNPFPVDIRSTLLCTAVEHFVSENAAAWNFLLSKIQQTRKDTLKTPLLNSLACTRNSTVLSNLLEMTLDPTSVLHSYTEHMLARVAMNSKGRLLSYEFAKVNLLASKISASTFATTVSTLSGYWGEDTHVDELKTFIESNANKLGQVQASLETSLGNIRANVNWWNTFGNRIRVWLHQN